MSTLRELAAESIGRITRRGLEPQIAQLEGAVLPGERVLAVAPGRAGAAGVVVVVTDGRFLTSSGAPFTTPTLEVHLATEIEAASAAAGDDGWTLTVEHTPGVTVVTGMFDRDAQRLAALMASPPVG